MDVDEVIAHCAAKPGAWPDNPFGHEHPVFKVTSAADGTGKIFVFVGSGKVGVKCGRTREEADEWLARFPEDASTMAYIGRSGWNDLRLGGAIEDDEVREAIDESYRLVVAGLARKYRPAGWDA